MTQRTNFNSLEIGDVIADMHYGISDAIHHVEEPLKVLHHVVFNLAGGHELIAKSIKPKIYVNKLLVVIDEAMHGLDAGCPTIKCMYSYDDVRFGVVQLCVASAFKPKLLVQSLVNGQLECCPRDAAGSPIVGRGVSVLEAVGEYAIQTQLVEVGTDPASLIDERYRVASGLRPQTEGCDRRG